MKKYKLNHDSDVLVKLEWKNLGRNYIAWPSCSLNSNVKNIFFYFFLFLQLTSGAIGKNGPTHSIYTKPQPLSAQIRQAVSSPVSHAAGINRMLEQSQEAWPSKWGSTTPYTPFRNKSQRRKALEPIESEDFVGLFTPKRKNLTR